jgi:multidrug resistance efflux pump
MPRLRHVLIPIAALLLTDDACVSAQSAKEADTGHRKSIAAAPGRIEGSSVSIDVGASISGIVDQVPVKQGDKIKVGQLLVRIDCSDIAARLEQRNAEYGAASAEYRKLVNGPRLREIDVAEADVELAQARLEEAQARYARSQSLVTRDAMSKADYDTALRDNHMANAQLISAQAHLQLLQEGNREEDLAAGKARMNAAQDAIAVTEAELAKCNIKSPIDGLVLSNPVSPGEVVSIYFPKPLLTIAEVDRFRVRAEVDENDERLIHVGQEAEIIMGDGQRLRGTVATYAPSMGRRKILTTDPADKSDRDVREAVIDLPRKLENLPIGLRVSVLFY